MNIIGFHRGYDASSALLQEAAVRQLFAVTLCFTAVVATVGCLSEPEKARRTLEVQGVEFTGDAFVAQAGAGATDVAQLFLTAGMDIDARSTEGRTALHEAAAGANEEAMTWLLEHGASLGAADTAGCAVIWRPVLEPDAGVLTFLLQHGAEVDSRDARGRTPLVHAAASDDVAIVRLLLDARADVNAMSAIGVTPLMNAAVTGGPEMLGLLLDAGADTAATDSHGKTAADVARSFDREDNAAFIETRGSGG